VEVRILKDGTVERLVNVPELDVIREFFVHARRSSYCNRTGNSPIEPYPLSRFGHRIIYR
jgi:hypothetical protein